jgi:hypothetical protein
VTARKRPDADFVLATVDAEMTADEVQTRSLLAWLKQSPDSDSASLCDFDRACNHTSWRSAELAAVSPLVRAL